MSNPIISVQNLSKYYRLGVIGSGTLREDVERWWAKIRRRPDPLLQTTTGNYGNRRDGQIWALRNVTFEVNEGEILGIIGRNGAGKSTLLKILSRITAPTSGQAVIKGRVGSLLEVGTGFHLELTGRENIYLNGTILGMRKAEVNKKLDEIVNFAEVERFIDTPVKRYSSGMLVRLAFSVAAHLEPEVLVVDEVLAVGDVAFRQKCLGKIGDVAKGGRTVLFVSHNMGAIRALCSSAILLERGTLASHGETSDIVHKYLRASDNFDTPTIAFSRDSSKEAQITKVSVFDLAGNLATHHPFDEPFEIQIQIDVRSRSEGVYLALHVHDKELRTLIFSRHFVPSGMERDHLEVGVHLFTVQCPAPLLVPDQYCVSVHFARTSPAVVIDGADHVCFFQLVDSGSDVALRGFPWRGSLAVPMQWRREAAPYSAL